MPARGARSAHPPGLVVVLIAAAVLVAGCVTRPASGHAGLTVVAAENIWGDLAAQLGGRRATVTSIIDKPGVDPHDYQPTVATARAVATARLVIVNGAGYDAWAGKLVAANPADGRIVLTVADVTGVPAGGNPHRWYSPTDVRTVVDRITAAYRRLDPADAGYFDQRHDELLRTGLARYFGLVAQIRGRYAGTPVGASESIFEPMAEATGLDLVTPARFLTAVSEGTEPSAADKATIDAQISGRRLAVYVENSQNTTPDVHAQVTAARAAHIPVVTITETPTPAGASFQDWQVRQLTALRQALAQATGR